MSSPFTKNGVTFTVSGDDSASVAQCYQDARDVTVTATGCPTANISYDKDLDEFSCGYDTLTGKDVPCALTEIAGVDVDLDCNVKVDLSKSKASCPSNLKTKTKN